MTCINCLKGGCCPTLRPDSVAERKRFWTFRIDDIVGMYRIYAALYTILWVTMLLRAIHSPTDRTKKEIGFLTASFAFVWIMMLFISQFRRGTPYFIMVLYAIVATLQALTSWNGITTSEWATKISYLPFNLTLVTMFLSPSMGVTLYFVIVHYFTIFLVVMQVEDVYGSEIMAALIYAPMQGLLAIGLFVILQKREFKRFQQTREA